MRLCNSQMSKVTKEHCLEIINKFEPCSENQKEGVLGIDGKFVGHRGWRFSISINI